MNLFFCGADEQLDAKAADLRRDLNLALEHLWTLPLILGSPRWLLWTRYQHARPYSELNILLYPYEMTRIAVQMLLTIGLAVPLLGAIIAALWLHEKVRIRRPLYLIIQYLPLLFNAHIISVSSPADKPATPACTVANISNILFRPNVSISDIRNVRKLLHNGKLFINRTSDCPMEGHEEVWFYVNGVAEQGAMVAATCTLLKGLTGRLVNPFVNASHGAPLDIMECIIGRSLNCASEPAATLARAVTQQLSRGRRVVLVGHSQGGIILSNVVNHLVNNATNNKNIGTDDSTHAHSTLLRRLEVYTFASAADEFAGTASGLPFAEHFATEDDFISRIGVLEFSDTSNGHKKKTWNGSVYKLESNKGFQGHLVKEMMLPAMKKGLFANDSTFWKKYCDPTLNSHLPIDHHRVEVFVPHLI